MFLQSSSAMSFLTPLIILHVLRWYYFIFSVSVPTQGHEQMFLGTITVLIGGWGGCKFLGIFFCVHLNEIMKFSRCPTHYVPSELSVCKSACLRLWAVCVHPIFCCRFVLDLHLQVCSVVEASQKCRVTSLAMETGTLILSLVTALTTTLLHG